jgi:hypothetical protein
LSLLDQEKIIARQRVKADTASVAPADELAALLAQHNTIGHVYLEIAVGPEWAAAALARNFDNRPLRQWKVKIMARAMTENRYADKQPHPICFNHLGVLADGQHRLEAIVLSGCTIIFTICFGCDPKERDHYDQGTPRSVSDIAREHGHQNTVLAQSVVAMILRTELRSAAPLDRNEQTERLDALYTESEDFEQALKASSRTKTLISPTTGALAFYHIAAHTTHRDKLEAFWEALAKGLLTEQNPVWRVRQELIKDRNQKGSRDLAVKKAGSIVLAWNALMERRRPRNFKWDTSLRLPEVV